MNEEEKKAIKRLEDFGNSISCGDYPPEAYIEMKEDIEDVLYVIENQQKEIEELKFKNRIRILGKYGEVSLEELIKDKFISKDKIREIIEELEKEKEKYFEKQIIQGRINLLNELLEE